MLRVVVSLALGAAVEALPASTAHLDIQVVSMTISTRTLLLFFRRCRSFVKLSKLAAYMVMFKPNHISFQTVQQSLRQRESYLKKREPSQHPLKVLALSVQDPTVDRLADDHQPQSVCDKHSKVTFEFLRLFLQNSGRHIDQMLNQVSNQLCF